MANYLLRRVLWIVFTILCVSLISFGLVFASGDPARFLAPTKPGQDPDPQVVELIRVQYGLDQPLPVQFVRYMGNVLRGDFGYSYYFRRPVSDVLFPKFGATALLAVLILVVALTAGIPLGVLAAIKRNSFIDRTVVVSAGVALSIPAFLLALVLIYVFAFQLQLFPIGGAGTWRHLILPVLSVAIPAAMGYALILRTSLLSSVHADYVRTAHAKGLQSQVVVFRHMLPNALIPLVTLVSIDLATLLTGIVLVETVFQYPGIGLQIWQSTQQRDIPVIMGSVFFGALFIGVGNLLADIIAAQLDPRIRLGS